MESVSYCKKNSYLFVAIMIVGIFNGGFMYQLYNSNKLLIPAIGLSLALIYIMRTIKIWTDFKGKQKTFEIFKYGLVVFFAITNVFDLLVYFNILM